MKTSPNSSPRMHRLFILAFVCLSSGLGLAKAQVPTGPTLPHPIAFVTQVPIPQDFTTIGSTFGNHLPSVRSVGRGGDLWIRYQDGTLKNLTEAAGFGNAGFQGTNSIAVREPCVSFDGQRILFSMVVGSTTQQYFRLGSVWQMYEVSGLGQNDTPVITKVPYQPENRNNVSPIYGSDDQIIFTSDLAHGARAHLYPQLDEYEEAPTVSGLWKLNPQTGHTKMLVHAPSGTFTPILDSYGRIVFTQWDHLQRDQQADADALGSGSYGTFNYSDESAQALALNDRTEVFPEPRSYRTDLLAGTNLEGHSFNHFFPWMINQDGTEHETLNHIGRHELHSYFNRALNDDPNLIEFISASTNRFNLNPIQNLFHIAEDPTIPGTYFGIDAPEFQTHSGGQVVKLSLPPGANPDGAVVTYITHPETRGVSTSPSSNHSGLYRDVLPLSNGLVVAAHTGTTVADTNTGSATALGSLYDFRLKGLSAQGAYFAATTPLTPGLSKSVSFWNPDYMVSFSGQLWELNPVEVRARPRPPMPQPHLPAPEAQAAAQAAADLTQFRAWLAQNGAAVIVTRDVTVRDSHDVQQPFNIRVAGTNPPVETIGAPGKVYDVAHLQLFQGDLLRGIGGPNSPRPGRRILAQPLHDALGYNPANPSGPAGSVAVFGDGSTAAIVPANRALSWQLTDSQGEPVVRERYWLSFQPGEIRSCTGCHGINSQSQSQGSEPQNTPLALTALLQHWQGITAPAPSLAALPAAVGTTGLGLGGPFDVLTINGSSGGVDRRVDAAQGAAFSLSVIAPPSVPGSASFILWGMIGVPSEASIYHSFLGDLLFPPASFAVHTPGSFTLANGFGLDSSAYFSPGPAPWSTVIPPGLPSGTTLTLQGVVEDALGGTSPFGVTNGLILRIL